jgi:hypothetical protein
MIVVRHLCGNDGDKVAARDPRTFMVVESSPGELDRYSFASERRLVESNLKLEKILCVPNPTLEELAEAIKQGKPDVIHLAGIDSHQGM